jgi:hypothetical protein
MHIRLGPIPGHSTHASCIEAVSNSLQANTQRQNRTRVLSRTKLTDCESAVRHLKEASTQYHQTKLQTSSNILIEGTLQYPPRPPLSNLNQLGQMMAKVQTVDYSAIQMG